VKPIISVEGLGKKYQIKHKDNCGGERSLREELLHLPKRLFSRKESAEEFWALENASFDIMPGDRIGIIGRNGAGKSTLLKLLSRITEPSAGKITMRGRVASLLEVGTGFHPELTGRENIFLNGAILGMSRNEIRAKFDEIVDFAGVEMFLDTPVKRYSSGMYVRLAFAVAAHLEPEILIVDEVLAVGDAEFQKKCLGKMEGVSKDQGRTILFVSHNMGAVQQLCDRALLLENGTVSIDGSVASAVSKYMAEDCSTGTIKRFSRSPAEPYFTEARIMANGKNIVHNNVFVGDSVRFCFAVAVDSEVEEKLPFNMELSIANEAGVVLSYFDATVNGQELSMQNRTAEVLCDVERLPLMSGDYTLTASVGAIGVSSQVTLEFKVISKAYAKNGGIAEHHQNGLYINHDWMLVNRA
jgi:lipopolysaccharide transport system ATP-binding protein